MGKKGDQLRLMKKQNTVYTFTREQLEEHDKQVIRENADNLKAKINIEMTEKLEKEMAKRDAQIFWNILPFCLSLACRVLVEKFKWTPIPKNRYINRKRRLAKFSDYLVDEVNVLFGEGMQDVRKYCDETYDLYGVKFKMGEIES